MSPEEGVVGTRPLEAWAGNWHWKSGQSSGAESFTCGACTSSEQMVSESNAAAGHPTSVCRVRAGEVFLERTPLV